VYVYVCLYSNRVTGLLFGLVIRMVFLCNNTACDTPTGRGTSLVLTLPNREYLNGV
jgi:hypothetical protein